MQKVILILILSHLLSSCYNSCGKNDLKNGKTIQYSKVSTQTAFPARDSSSRKIELNENETIHYRDLFLVWKPDFYYFSEAKKQWNILNELIPAAYACDPVSNAPIPKDSIQFINIKSTKDWNLNYKADSSLNSIFSFYSHYESNYNISNILNNKEYLKNGVSGPYYFKTEIAPDSIQKHVFIIDLILKNGTHLSDTLKPVFVSN